MIHEVNDAVAKRRPGGCRIDVFMQDVVWEHNIGSGSPEEGVYRGRET